MEKVVTRRSLSEKFNQEPKTSQGRTKMNAEKNFGNEESAMKTKDGRAYNVFCENAALERKEIISLLAQRMAQLPELQKKVLAMYYYESMQAFEDRRYLRNDRVSDLPNSRPGGRRAPQILN